jgi:hypothetical protein
MRRSVVRGLVVGGLGVGAFIGVLARPASADGWVTPPPGAAVPPSVRVVPYAPPAAPVAVAAPSAPVAAAPVSTSWWCQDPPPACPCPGASLKDTLVCVPCVDACIERFEKGKADSCFKLGAGAYHWWHYDTVTEDFTYGYPGGGEGTYFYYVNIDVDCAIDHCFVKSVGGHAQIRFRDETVFRSFFDEQVWFYEGYGYVDTTAGKLKVGKIWKRFGLDWDDSFWGNVAYYDGYKLDPDYGVSLEKTWGAGKRMQLDAFAQFFFDEDEVNGSLEGGDAESTDAFEERNTLVLRAVPTVNFDVNTSLAVGGSFLYGQIGADTGGSHDLTGWAVDSTFTWCGLKVYGEIASTDGIQNPSHYVTNGPSDLYTDWQVGGGYTLGPATLRAAFSHGDYENPSGEQDLLLIGLDVRLTKWLTATVEYVKWDVTDGTGTSTPFEDGWQFVLHWDV